jgi:hypothetical protein
MNEKRTQSRKLISTKTSKPTIGQYRLLSLSSYILSIETNEKKHYSQWVTTRWKLTSQMSRPHRQPLAESASKLRSGQLLLFGPGILLLITVLSVGITSWTCV